MKDVARKIRWRVKQFKGFALNLVVFSYSSRLLQQYGIHFLEGLNPVKLSLNMPMAVIYHIRYLVLPSTMVVISHFRYLVLPSTPMVVIIISLSLSGSSCIIVVSLS